MIDYKQLKEHYPKTYNEYDLKFNISKNSDIYGDHHPHYRVLFDFFDDKDLSIAIIPELIPFNHWKFKIRIGDRYYERISLIDKNFRSRKECEIAAIFKCFELSERIILS